MKNSEIYFLYFARDTVDRFLASRRRLRTGAHVENFCRAIVKLRKRSK